MKRKVYERSCTSCRWNFAGYRIESGRGVSGSSSARAAGKGGTIKAITERVSPRVFRVAALPTPPDREKTEMFMQRYIERFPARARSSSSTAAGITGPVSST
jgi:polyphosphate kinase